MPIKISKITLICLAGGVVLFYSAYSLAQSQLPPPDHPLLFGYYHVDSQYGDFKNEVKDYTNTQIIIGDSWIRPPNITETDIQKLNEALSETAALGQKIVLIPSGDPDIILNAAAPFWDKIEFIYFANEPDWDKAETEREISRFKNKIAQAGLTQKQVAINYTPEQIQNSTSYQAANLDIVGFEAYADPSLQSSPDLVQTLSDQIDASKQKIGDKKIFIVIQAYDRNGAWNNLNSLTDIQTPPYLKSYNDSRVMGLFLFSYARPGGTRDNSVLINTHKEIGQAIRTTVNTGDIPIATPISTWSPNQTGNGWWPSLSPDGRYVAYGNWGESWVTDLQTNQNWDFRNPPGLNATDSHRCIAGQWIKPDTVRFVCDSIPGVSGFYSYEVKTGEWVARRTNDNPDLVIGNIIKVKDGHWASYGTPFRIAKDNQIIATNVGGAISISGDMLVHACTNDNRQICVWEGDNQTAAYDVQTPLFEMDTESGYIAYGGFGPIRGIDSSGKDIDLTATSWKREGSPKVLMVNGKPWIATYTWDDALGISNVLLRPWGERKSIVLKMDAVSLSVIYANGNFVVAGNDSRGSLSVQTIPANSPRTDLSGGMPPEQPGTGTGLRPFSTVTQPTIPTEGLPGFGQLIAMIFTWSLSILGIVVFVMIFFAGFRWFTAAGNTATVNEARGQITNAITGAIILLAAWIILYTINPDLVGGTFTLPGVGKGPVSETVPVVYQKDVVNDQDVYSSFPTGAIKGVIYFFHGTGGSALSFSSKLETKLVVAEALNRNYGVIFASSQDSHNKVGNKRWSPSSNIVTNPDLNHLRNVSDYFINKNKFKSDTPEFGIGMSNGGGFVSFAGFALNYKAISIHNAKGYEQVFSQTSYKTPTFFVYTENDSIIAPSEVLQSIRILEAKGIPLLQTLKKEEQLSPLRLTRIPEIDSTESTEIHNQLKNSGFIDAQNNFIRSPKEVTIQDIGTKYRSSFNDIADQLFVVYGEHIFLSDYRNSELSFFDSNMQ